MGGALRPAVRASRLGRGGGTGRSDQGIVLVHPGLKGRHAGVVQMPQGAQIELHGPLRKRLRATRIRGSRRKVALPPILTRTPSAVSWMSMNRAQVHPIRRIA